MIRTALVALLFSALSTASASAAESRIFTAFKTYCADTDARPDAVKAAVDKAGDALTLKKPEKTADGESPWRWSITVDGGKLTLISGRAKQSPKDPIPTMAVENCTLLQNQSDNGADAAIAAWSGLKPFHLDEYADVKTSHYRYARGAAGFSPLADDPVAINAALAAGGLWELDLAEGKDLSIIQFRHFIGSGK